MNFTQVLILLACVIGVLLIGFVSGMSTADSINNWYVTIKKPSFNPPNWIFGPVWTLLYLIMGIGLFLIIKSPSQEGKNIAILIFGTQLVLNFFWSLIFFRWQSLGWALAEIIVMWIMILLMILKFYPVNKTAALMQIPYLVWVSFAAVLNFSIWKLN